MKSENGFLIFSAAAATALFLFSLSAAPSGETAAASKLLPVVSAFMALWGMYRIGGKLISPAAGWLSAAALLASPFFVMQSMKPIPETVAVAAVIWSLYFYINGRYLYAVLFSTLGIVCQGQLLFIPAAFFIAEITENSLRKPGRLLLFASPVPAILLNHLLNGSTFSPFHFDAGSELSQELFLQQLRSISILLLSADFRWLLTTAAVAGMVKDRGRDTHSLPFILALLFPAVIFPPERLLFIAFLGAGLVVYLIRERLYTTKLTTVFVLVPLLAILFCAAMGVISPDSDMDDLRCMIPAYPFIIIGGITILFRYYSKGTATVLSLLFIASTAYSNVV